MSSHSIPRMGSRFALSTLLICLALPGCTWHMDSPLRVNHRRARMAVRGIIHAEEQYFQKAGRYGSLRELGPSGVKLIDDDTSSGSVGVYRVTVELQDGGYQLTAKPRREADARVALSADQTGDIQEYVFKWQ